MTQGERVKEVRKKNNLTLEKFGERLGVTKQTISRIENDINNLTEQMAISICREYNVDKTWLVTGEGSDRVERPRSEQLHDFVDKIQVDDNTFKKRLVSLLSEMSESEWELLEKMVLRLKEESDAQQEADEFADMAREQFLSEQKPESPAFSAKESDAV